VYFNIRNTLPKSGTFLLGHPVYELKKEKYVGFKALRMTVIKTAIFWDVMICSLVDRYI
jgi:hypothetical protein